MGEMKIRLDGRPTGHCTALPVHVNCLTVQPFRFILGRLSANCANSSMCKLLVRIQYATLLATYYT